MDAIVYTRDDDEYNIASGGGKDGNGENEDREYFRYEGGDSV